MFDQTPFINRWIFIIALVQDRLIVPKRRSTSWRSRLTVIVASICHRLIYIHFSLLRDSNISAEWLILPLMLIFC